MFLAFAACKPAPAPAHAVHDQIGNAFQPGPVQRVVPLAPDVTELAFALTVGDLIMAVPAAADFPAQTRDLPKVLEGDPESILAYSPDAVLATTAGNDSRVVERLRALGVRVFTVDVTSFERLADAYRTLGRALGRAEIGEQRARELEAQLRTVREQTQPLPARRALYVVWWLPLVVASPGTFHDDLLRRAGLDNAAPSGAGRYPTVNPELLLDPRLEQIVTPDEPDVRAGFESLLATPAGARLANGSARVAWLPADPASRPGPRLIEALQALVAARQAAP